MISTPLLTLLEQGNYLALKPRIAEENPVDLARLLEELSPAQRLQVFRILPKDLAADTFVELDRDTQQRLLYEMADHELRAMMDELFLDDAVDLVEEMPANVVKRLLAQSDPQTRESINRLLRYPKDSAGSIMTPEFISLQAEMTVEQAFEKIRRLAIDSETIYTCYVTDRSKHLTGHVSAKDLMLAPRSHTVGQIMDTHVIRAHTGQDRETVARMLADYGFLALPIVDTEDRLVGIVTVDDAIEVLQQETTEDIAKMAATAPSDKPYLKTRVWEIYKNRLPWLLILMVSATFTGWILNVYETRLAAISSVLFACVPMLMDTGGNCGAQASVTVIRALSLGELRTRDLLAVLAKELRAALLLGLTLALACYAKLRLLDGGLMGFAGYTPLRCGVIALTLFCTVLLAKAIGGTLPLLAKACRLDPAVVASPLITTLVDALALMLYCTLAVTIL